MNIRHLLRLAIAAGVGWTAAGIAAAEYQEGQHYQKLPIVVETRDPARVEVVEVFSYACIHCYRLEPMVEAWRQAQPEDVDFYRLPLVSQRLLSLAQAFYTAEALGVLERVHVPMFAAIHDYGINLSRAEYIRRLFVREAEVDEEEFLRVYDSFGIRSRVRQADAQGRMYRVMATPTLIVNGRYVVDATSAGGPAAMFLVVNHLVELERKAAEG